MDIYKAIKMEKKSLKRFYKLMGILFIGLPLSVYLTGVRTIFFLVYLLKFNICICWVFFCGNYTLVFFLCLVCLLFVVCFIF